MKIAEFWGIRRGSELREGLPERLRGFWGGKFGMWGLLGGFPRPEALGGGGEGPGCWGAGPHGKGAGPRGGVNPFVAAPQRRAMAVQEARPNHTIYINNLNEKIKKDGEGRGGGRGGGRSQYGGWGGHRSQYGTVGSQYGDWGGHGIPVWGMGVGGIPVWDCGIPEWDLEGTQTSVWDHGIPVRAQG